MIARALLVVVLAAGILHAQVGLDRILHPEKGPQNWLTYSGSLTVAAGNSLYAFAIRQ